MSLINEALKKAERLRNEAAADSAPASLGGGPRIRRGSTQNSGTMVLIGSGALVLVVLSVVFTVYLVNRPAKPTAAARVAAVTPESTTPKQTSVAALPETETPAIVLPSITPSSASVPSVTQSANSATGTNAAAIAGSVPPPSATPAAVNGTAPAATPLATVPVGAGTRPATAIQSLAATPTSAAAATAGQGAVSTPTAPEPVLAPDAPDERVTAFVDAVRVTGIRSSGAESRVLMNERVYRVNDIVERTLNIRLVNAAADSLTFSDGRGVTYVKRF